MRDPRDRLVIVAVVDMVRRGRLAWFGHLGRRNAAYCVSGCRNMNVDGGRGRPHKIWVGCITKDMKELGLYKKVAQYHVWWKSCIFRKPPDSC